MEGLFALLGWEVATGAKKAPPFSSVFKALGVQVDVSQAHLGTIQVTNTPERLEALRAEVQSVVASGKLTSGEAASLRGRFQFAASQTFGRFGIVPLKLLAGRADSSNGSCLLDAALRQALEALMCHVVSGPPRCIRIKDARRPVVVFTDGAAEEGVVTCGAIAYAEEWDAPRFFSLTVPAPLTEMWLLAGTRHQVAQAELLPVALAKHTFSAVLLHRRVLWFLDNDAVRAALVTGNTSAPALYDLLAEVAQLDALTPSFSGFERVPSLSNPADAASRLRAEEMGRRHGAQETAVSWPSGLALKARLA